MQWTTKGTWMLKLEGKECKVSQRICTKSSLTCIKPEKVFTNEIHVKHLTLGRKSSYL
jgi:hypothetical protein